jgi:N utilization substance protein A
MIIAMHAPTDGTDEVRGLFHEHIPEVASGVIEIKAIARARGKRAIVAVHSTDNRIDPVGSCVGQRGIRAKTIMQQLGGEKLDCVRWSDSLKTLLTNSLAPAKIDEVFTNDAARRAIIFTNSEGKQSILGSDGLRLKLVSHLVGWELQVETG